jgi:hypothetical protein
MADRIRITIRGDCHENLLRGDVNAGCIGLQNQQLFLGFFGGMLSPSLPRLAARAAKQSKLLYDIMAERTNVITKLSASPDPSFSTGFLQSTIVGAGCSCHQRGATQSLKPS